MASTSTKQSSRFSTFKVFKFAGSKPPPPPPKDPNYLYSTSNPSVLSFSNQSVSIDSISQPPTPYSSNYQHSLSARSPSPAPSRTTQSPGSSSGLTPDSANTKKGFFKIASIRKRSFSKSSRTTPVEESHPPDDGSISMPWNFQHHVHVDEALQGIPPSWSTSLSEAGFSEAEIAAIQQARRTRSPALDSVAAPSSYSRSHSPASITASTLINPRPRSSSLRRQRSDVSLPRSERSHRPAAPPLPPLPTPPRKFSNASESLTAANAGDHSFFELDASDSIDTHSDSQYVFVDQSRRGMGQSTVTGLQPNPFPHSPDSMRAEPSARMLEPGQEPSRTPPRRPFRVINETPPGQRSPPPAYVSPMNSDFTTGNNETPPALTAADAARPLPVEKVRPAAEASSSQPERELERTANASWAQIEVRQEEPQMPQTSPQPSPEASPEPSPHPSPRHGRPPRLSILPPRLSLRKDAIDDLSTWTASLFSSIPSSVEGSPADTPETPGLFSASPASTPPLNLQSSPSRKPLPKPVPDILLNSKARTEEDDEDDPNDYTLSASPLYNELMGMMQDQAPIRPVSTETIIGSDSPLLPGSPSSPHFSAHLDAAAMRGRTSARDSSNSQLTLRIDPRRNSDRDSNASGSTITHATIVRGASIVRRVQANVVASPSREMKGKDREALMQMEELDEGEEETGLTVPRQTTMEVTPRQSFVEQSASRRSSGSSSRSSTGSGGSGYGFSGSPAQTLSMTSGSNSQEDGGLKSPGLPYVQSSPSARPDSPSTLAASPLEAPADEVDARAHIRRPSIIITTDVVSPSGITPSTVGAGSLGSASSSTPRSGTSSASPHAQRYPGWLSEVVKPLAEFIDECIDPRDLFIDLQEIAEGESGSVFSALVVATSPGQRKVHSFKPPTPTSPFPDSSVQELVAIKSVPILPSGSSKLFDLRRELELMRDLRHPNILKMERLYVDLVEDSLWIGMELMERSLADVLGVQAEEGGEELVVGEKMVARFVWDVLLALSYIRKQHIAHRDLRSDNLLLNRDGVLKISDFSSAVRAPPGTPKSSENVGVIYWQAPEMRTGLYDPLKVDVWSLGATTWELVEGEPPFSDVQDTRQIGQQLPPLSNPDIFSRSFHDFLHLCSQPVGSRPDPDELLNAHYIRTACPRSAIVQMLAQCKSIEEQRLRRQSVDSQGTFTLP